jgi:hypothetical protein
LTPVQNYQSFGNLFAEFQILKGLKYKADFGIDRLLLEQKSVSRTQFSRWYKYYNTAIQNKYVVTNTLSYEKSFGRHNLSGVVGSTYEQNDVIETVEASDFASDLIERDFGCYEDNN